jgi:hypothetical protein
MMKIDKELHVEVDKVGYSKVEDKDKDCMQPYVER